MKRIVISIMSGLLAVTSVFALVGCGSDTKGNNASSAATQSSAAAESSAQASEAKSDDKAATISAADAVFTFNGVNVELNGDADAAVAALGTANDVSSQLSCHGQGDDKTYTYTGFVLNTYPLDGKDRVLEVVVKSADIPTSKGVKVGDDVSAVTSAYGDNFRKVGVYYAYDAGEGKSLQFLIEGDKVTEIDYYYDV